MRRSHTINAARNERVKAQLIDALRSLNARGVEPVLLKGTTPGVRARLAIVRPLIAPSPKALEAADGVSSSWRSSAACAGC